MTVDECIEKAAYAIRTAQLWRAGKMIGGCEDEVRNGLLKLIEELQEEISRLQADRNSNEGIKPFVVELHEQWRMNHHERCSNAGDCSSYFNADRECSFPRPEILQRNLHALPESLRLEID